MTRARDIADFGEVTARLDTVGASEGALSNRNLIINSEMKVSQRGTQTDQTSAYTACDRWQFTEGGASIVTTTKDSNVPSAQGFASSLKIDVTTADTSVANNDFAFVRTKLEGQDLQQLLYGTSSAKQITLSFWVSSPKTGIHVVELRHRDASGGTQYNNQQYTITTANTWQNVTMTFVGQTTDAFDDDNEASLEVVFWLMAGSTYAGGTFVSNTWATASSNRAVGQVNVMDSTSNNFYLTGVQLEVGDTATDFEHRSYGDQLRACQRYYYEISGDNSLVGHGFYYGSSEVDVLVNFPVPMRAAPSLTASNNTNDFVFQHYTDTFNTWTGIQYYNGDSLNMYVTSGVSGTAGQAGYARTNTSTGKLQFSSEL